MKKMSKILTAALVASTAFTLGACAEEGTTPDTKPDITVPEVVKELKINKTLAEVVVGETVDVTVTSKNLTGELTIKSSTTNVTWTNTNGVVTFTAHDKGSATVTFTQDELTQTLHIVTLEESEVFTAFKADGTEIDLGENANFYVALNVMLTTDVGVGAVIKNSSDEVVYSHNPNAPFKFFDANGMSNAIFSEDLLADGGKYASVGHTAWWQNYITDLGLMSQNKVNMLNGENNRFTARPTEFNLPFSDGYPGFNTDPNGTWNGWLSSTYRAGISVAQYAGWADLEVGENMLDQFIFEYDLSNGAMKPSQNANFGTRADIWLGSSHNDVCADVMLGITFDAGSIETTKDLANGTTRGWYLFSEPMDGVNSNVQATRTLSDEAIGTATWDKANGVWIHDFSITLDLELTTDENDNLLRVMTGTIGDETISISVNEGAPRDITKYRFTYGVNYTPYGNGIVDIQNGGYWTGVTQANVKGYDDGVSIRNYDFLAGRTVNGGNQTGLYGCDVVSANIVARKTVFNFTY